MGYCSACIAKTIIHNYKQLRPICCPFRCHDLLSSADVSALRETLGEAIWDSVDTFSVDDLDESTTSYEIPLAPAFSSSGESTSVSGTLDLDESIDPDVSLSPFTLEDFVDKTSRS